MQKAKTYDELSFTDDFLFGKILTENPDVCKELLELIIGKKIRKLVYTHTQETIKPTSDGKGVRLDVYLEDDNNTVYDIEMQTTPNKNLPKRSRYYQGMIDLNLISSGENYEKLRTSYIIFICTFDAFGKGLPVYTFKNTCEEDPALKLGDESIKIFLNPKGADSCISKELKDFLTYLLGYEADGKLSKKVDTLVQRARDREEWRLEFMTLFMREQEIREEARNEGLKEGRFDAICALVQDGLLSTEVGAKQLDMSIEEFKEMFITKGYRFP